MDEATEELLYLLDMPSEERGIFIGPPAHDERHRVFGGQVLAQALAAASFTVEEGLDCHSLHAYFLRPGKPGRPTEYEVSAMRDGQTFSMRQVIAMQRNEVNFQMVASFSRNEGELEQQMSMPDVPDPESFGSEDERIEKALTKVPEDQEELRAQMRKKRPIEIVPADAVDRFSQAKHEPRRQIWMRVRGELPSDPNLHRCALAYASDFMILDCCLLPLGVSYASRDMQIASVDHAMWFHRELRFDDWLLFVYDSPATAGGRGLGRATVFDRDGALVASIAQEGLMRQRD